MHELAHKDETSITITTDIKHAEDIDTSMLTQITKCAFHLFIQIL